MKIKTKNNVFLVFLILFLSSFSLVACGNSKNTAKQEANNSQQNVNSLFEKAQNALGNGYQHGFWENVDFDNAVYWYNKAIENNEPHAAYNLASLYEKGEGVKQDFDLAYAYYTLAKEFGLDVAQKNYWN
ncbi:tetratricopeptide repeat protein [Acinetobacter sp. YQ_14]|uniref:tetratricopeptide repeat protein n=1 Tax=Acinetobacter sp. YQ_14 TaxID=3367236 RepID=UPI00370A21FB